MVGKKSARDWGKGNWIGDQIKEPNKVQLESTCLFFN